MLQPPQQHHQEYQLLLPVELPILCAYSQSTMGRLSFPDSRASICAERWIGITTLGRP